MRPSDQTELEALARLSATPEWRQVLPMLQRQQAEQEGVLRNAIELHKIHRAQGAVLAVSEFLELVTAAPGILRSKRGQ